MKVTSTSLNKSVKIIKIFILLLIFNCSFVTAQNNFNGVESDSVKAGRFDTGRMWTFEYPPTDYFEDEYNFKPDKEWYDNVRMSALKFATYCSASFVSEDGLIMTNEHCAEKSVTQVNKEGEDLHENGFIAYSTNEERPVPGLYVDQLVLIEDVTDEIQDAMNKETSDEKKFEIESEKISEIEKRYEDKTGLIISVTPLYNGARYSLYGYKRYNDVRLVFVPEFGAAYFGGEEDNFTYPRYNLDCSFFRVYDENGKPLKTKHYLKWSENGIQTGELVFVVGNPGLTNRLKTVSQLEFMRDVTYPNTIDLLNRLIEVYRGILSDNDDSKAELNDQLLNFLNSLKAYTGMLKGLRNPVLMQRKRDFEQKFKSEVQSDDKLNKLYGNLWDDIEAIQKELKNLTNEKIAYSTNQFDSPQYFNIADELIEIANELKLPENKRNEFYLGDELDYTIQNLIPEDFDPEYNKTLLKQKISVMYKNFGDDNELLQKFTNGKKGDDAVNDILSRSSITTVEDIRELIKKGPDAILSGDDPFINFVKHTKPRINEIDDRTEELLTKDETCNYKLGKAVFEVYGTSIPPEATFTLRISDGIVKGFPYNGTIAPPITTFYGMLDRYYSFDKKFPWNLDDKWLNAPEEFDFSTPFNFVATNDITGGNSGSPVINKDGEIVGLVFDGNYQSLPGDFIYSSEENRMVAVHSKGIMESIKDLYKVKRLAEELRTGKLPD